MLPGSHRMSLCLLFFFFLFVTAPLVQKLCQHDIHLLKRDTGTSLTSNGQQNKTKHEHLVQSKLKMLTTTTTTGQHAETLNQRYMLQIKGIPGWPHEKNKTHLQGVGGPVQIRLTQRTGNEHWLSFYIVKNMFSLWWCATLTSYNRSWMNDSLVFLCSLSTATWEKPHLHVTSHKLVTAPYRSKLSQRLVLPVRSPATLTRL